MYLKEYVYHGKNIVSIVIIFFTLTGKRFPKMFSVLWKQQYILIYSKEEQSGDMSRDILK